MVQFHLQELFKKNGKKFQKDFFIQMEFSIFAPSNQNNYKSLKQKKMGKSVMTEAQKKAKKAAYDKAYRERKKMGIVAREVEVAEPKVKKVKPLKEAKETTPESVVETFTKTFGFPVRLYWNQRIEEVNSSCAKPGTELSFEEMGKKGKATLYRVRRGKRNFFTTSNDLVDPQE
jgi:hypothetical protein